MYLKSNRLLGYLSVFFVLLLTLSLNSKVFSFNGPHILAENPCNICHIPHHAADDMLWARKVESPFSGVKRLCSTCHGIGLYGAKDFYGIFETHNDNTFDHVMGKEASINVLSVIRSNWTDFPLEPDKEGGDGFYCGSCHDPHRDPYEPFSDEGGGDYLREEIKESIKNIKDKETTFCTQCHKEIIRGDAKGHGDKHGCFDCHHPHSSPNPGKKILICPLTKFVARPNCPGFTDSEESVAACYGCHKAYSGFDGSLGAPLEADDLGSAKEHHPMGIGADVTTSGHQPTQGGQLSPAGELYCSSCHSVHNGTNDSYINPDIITKLDIRNFGKFCIVCHSDKEVEDLGTQGKNHHQVLPYNQCLFCHSIHNSPGDPDALYQIDEDEATQDNSSVSVDVIMRIPPINLVWGDKTLDTDTRDYEDACYGCHADEHIVGNEYSLNEENAYLFDNVRDKYFSHRFNAVPSNKINLLSTFEDRLPIVSDGKEKEAKNDYGIDEGRIWCGSCHDVHRQNKFPDEVPEEYKERRSAYLRADNYGSSFCYSCHTDYHKDTYHGGQNHPQDVPLKGDLIIKELPYVNYNGYSGGIGGITNGFNAFDTFNGEVVCQSCHSVHTARTDWDGSTNNDSDPVHGNLLINPLDEGFCEDCHGYLPHHKFETIKFKSCVVDECHHPHRGILAIDKGIFFKAPPNVPEINDDPNRPKSSRSCYACHQPRHLTGDNSWRTLGVAPITGASVWSQEKKEFIKIEDSSLTMNHHPMGTEAQLPFKHAGEEAIKILNSENQITCISCHDMIEGEKENNFLRWDFSNDNAMFCVKCHDDKSDKLNDNKHFKSESSTVSRYVFNPSTPDYKEEIDCRQCMFCHFIHDGESRGNETEEKDRTDVMVILRIRSRNLKWDYLTLNDTDDNDYEDMCYGCHGNEDIVGNCFDGAFLNTNLHSHRFRGKPIKVNIPGVFSLSDGDGQEGETVFNDYGTKTGEIFCGTCHNVHDNTNTPYLRAPGLSPYENKPFGFCEECHDYEETFLSHSHPIGKDVNPLDNFKNDHIRAFYTNDPKTNQGCEGGYLSSENEMICLTCHNVHAAATDWKGYSTDNPNLDNPNIPDDKHGKLLVKDNYKTESGSDLCKDCHTFE